MLDFIAPILYSIVFRRRNYEKVHFGVHWDVCLGRVCLWNGGCLGAQSLEWNVHASLFCNGFCFWPFYCGNGLLHW